MNFFITKNWRINGQIEGETHMMNNFIHIRLIFVVKRHKRIGNYELVFFKKLLEEPSSSHLILKENMFNICRNPNFGLVTKARACEGASQE